MTTTKNLSECCDAPINKMWLCVACKEHAENETKKKVDFMDKHLLLCAKMKAWLLYKNQAYRENYAKHWHEVVSMLDKLQARKEERENAMVDWKMERI